MSERGAIIVRGIQFEANHGASAAERERTRRFEVDLEVRAPAAIAQAGASDRLVDTVDYRELCWLVIRAGTESTCHLVEKVAARVLAALRGRHPTCGIEVECRKLDPPCPGTPRFAAVRLTYEPD
ncbi:MAG TPA: dihydroneopterin aldolase [Polyangia bacterium]